MEFPKNRRKRLETCLNFEFNCKYNHRYDVGINKLIDSFLNCKFAIYISYCKKINSWAISYTYCKHNHIINPDLFSYNIYQSWCVCNDKVVELAKSLWDEIFYKKGKIILKNHDLKIKCKEFYNFTQKKTTKKLNTQEKLCFLLVYLDKEDFWDCFHEVYIFNDTSN